MRKSLALVIAVVFLLVTCVPALATVITAVGPCGVFEQDTPPQSPPAQQNDEQSVSKTLPIRVDIVHSLYLNTLDKETGAQKDSLDLGNVSPLAGYVDPLGKGGVDGIDIHVKSNDEWVKHISWTNLDGVQGDDAEGSVILAGRLDVRLDGVSIETPHDSALHQEHESVENLTITFNPVWCEEAGEYRGAVCIRITQM